MPLRENFIIFTADQTVKDKYLSFQEESRKTRKDLSRKSPLDCRISVVGVKTGSSSLGTKIVELKKWPKTNIATTP